MLALLERHPDITAVRMREELASLGYKLKVAAIVQGNLAERPWPQ
jgi:hypothetical protein